MLKGIIVILATAVSIAVLQFVTAPYVWISFLWSALLLYATISGTKRSLKIASYSMSIFILTLGVGEGYLWLKQDDEDLRRYEGEKYQMKDNLLGYALQPGRSVSQRRYYDEELLFDVTYTIGSNGLRVSPPLQQESAECVLFFGGSFTFGHGLNDHETMPYLVGLSLDGKYRIHNFGVSGYGPHQMLSALEHGVVESVLDCEPTYAIYQFIRDHIRRSAGMRREDSNGPRYILKQNGEVEYNGSFDDEGISLGAIKEQLRKSLVYERIFGRQRLTRESDIDLLVGIVERSRKILSNSHPAIEFHVVAWGSKNSKKTKAVWEGLRSKDIKVHFVREILPDYLNNKAMYRISPHDGHPSAAANRIIAEYIAGNVVDVEPTSMIGSRPSRSP